MRILAIDSAGGLHKFTHMLLVLFHLMSLVSEMTYNVLMGTLNLTPSLTHSLTHSLHLMSTWLSVFMDN